MDDSDHSKINNVLDLPWAILVLDNWKFIGEQINKLLELSVKFQ